LRDELTLLLLSQQTEEQFLEVRFVDETSRDPGAEPATRPLIDLGLLNCHFNHFEQVDCMSATEGQFLS